MFKYSLEDEVKDRISGLKGVIMARCEYLNGCLKYEVQPKGLKDAKMQESYWIDEQQLVIVKALNAEKSKPGGGPMNTPTERHP